MAHGDYCCIADRQTEMSAIFGGASGISRVILIFIYLFHDFSRNHDWVTHWHVLTCPLFMCVVMYLAILSVIEVI